MVALASVWRLNVSSPSMLLVVRLSTVYPSFFLFLFLLSVTRGRNPLVCLVLFSAYPRHELPGISFPLFSEHDDISANNSISMLGSCEL